MFRLSRGRLCSQGVKGVDNIYTQHKPLLSRLLDDVLKGRLRESSFPYHSSGYSQPLRSAQTPLDGGGGGGGGGGGLSNDPPVSNYARQDLLQS